MESAAAETGTRSTSLVSFVRVGIHEDAMVDVKDVETVKRSWPWPKSGG